MTEHECPDCEADKADERARKRRELLASNPRYACLNCIRAFNSYDTYADHMDSHTHSTQKAGE